METVIPLFETPFPAPPQCPNELPTAALPSGIEQPGLVNVLNLATGEEIHYLLDPRLAVVCAFEQYGRRNWNTWSYLPPAQHPQYREGVCCASCGDFTALLRPPTAADMRELRRRSDAILQRRGRRAG